MICANDAVIRCNGTVRYRCAGGACRAASPRTAAGAVVARCSRPVGVGSSSTGNAMENLRIYLHSARTDFAQTQRMPAFEYLGRHLDHREQPFGWFACGCGKVHLVRVPRSRLMRLMPMFRLYMCRKCGQQVFRPRMRQRPFYGSACLPAAPLPPDAHRIAAHARKALTYLAMLRIGHLSPPP